MPKDYAKKKTPRKGRGASRKNKKKSVPVTLWLFTLLFVSTLVTGLVYLKWYRPASPVDSKPVKKTPPAKISAPKKQAPPPKKSGSQEKDKIPLYDLHQDLINKEVKIPQEDLKRPDNLNKYYYLMTCGAFRESARAEELKARIALTGNNSTVKAVQSKGETWHRVQIGPINRKRTAESIRHRLQDNDVLGCIINRHIKASE